MTNIALSIDAFPAVDRLVRAQWAPVLFTPMAGSVERFVIGVVAVSDTSFALEQANALGRLRCLYGSNAEAAIFGAVVALEQLENELASVGTKALAQLQPRISGVEIGSARDAEGANLAAIAANWMLAISSLYRSSDAREIDEAPESASSSGEGIDKLPRLIMDYVSARNHSLARHFRQDLIGAQRRRKNHEIMIDFEGSRLVANFGILQPGAVTKSVDHVKRRLWDLKVKRDDKANGFLVIDHEMIVQMPDRNDPMITARQHENLMEAHRSLEEQADQEELRLRPLPSVAAIGERVIAAETQFWA